MFGGLGMWEIMLIFLVVLLLFGAKRLPEIGSSLGRGSANSRAQFARSRANSRFQTSHRG